MSSDWQRITALFGAARLLDDGARAAFLDNVCGADTGLRHEVDRLLAESAQHDSFLTEPAWHAPSFFAIASVGPGTVLKDRYRIDDAVASGGQAIVYRATDTVLSRSVIVKVLRSDASHTPWLISRFEREMKALSQIDHPGVVGIFDIGELSDGRPFLVIQYVNGVSLRDELKKGPLAPERAAHLLRQLASALRAAHSASVAHRDLKPENIMVQQVDGESETLKLIDFGISNVNGEPAGSGLVAGTVRYMAPEQFQGEGSPASDIYALAIVVCEMLCGHPDSRALPPSIGKKTRTLIEKALAYRPEARPSDLGRWSDDLSQALALGDRSRPGLRWWLAAAAIAVILAGIRPATAIWRAAASGPMRVGAPSSPGASRTQPLYLRLSEQVLVATEDPVRSFAISRDGRRVVYIAEADGVRCLNLLDTQSGQTKRLAGTEDPAEPFFSPDGERVGFVAGDSLKTIALGGGAPTVLASMPSPRGATWAPDETIIYSPATDGGLWQVPVNGGTPRLLIEPDFAKGERTYRWPTVSADGETLVFTVGTSDILSFDDARLAARSLRTRAQREVLRGGSHPTLVENGELVYTRAGALLTVPFDTKRLKVTGVPRPFLDGVETYPASGDAQYSISSTGILLYTAGKPETQLGGLKWMTRDGRSTEVGVAPAAFQEVSISPDNTRAALKLDGANGSIWILDLNRVTMSRLTLEWSNHTPVWTPDGSRVAFSSTRRGVRELYWQRVDGRGVAEPMLPSGQPFAMAFGSSWSPDGRFAILAVNALGTGEDLWVASLDGSRTLRPLVQTPFNESYPALSPDGRWLAYASDETGSWEVYAQPYQGPGRRWRISTAGGTVPVWSRDGRELFYRTGDALMAVRVAGALAPTRPTLLFRHRMLGSYDVASDGRFLIIEDMRPAAWAHPVTAVLNWRAMLSGPEGR